MNGNDRPDPASTCRVVDTNGLAHRPSPLRVKALLAPSRRDHPVTPAGYDRGDNPLIHNVGWLRSRFPPRAVTAAVTVGIQSAIHEGSDHEQPPDPTRRNCAR